MRNAVANSVLGLAVALGGGALVLFGWFLLVGPLSIAVIGRSEPERLAWDVLLSLLFFCQHSGMVRRSVRARLGAIIPEWNYPAAYAIASGAALALVVLLWQPSEITFYRLEGSARWAPWLAALLAAAGFAWSLRALRSIDLFGIAAIRSHARGRQPRPPEFAVRGPYRYVRHPLYFLMLVLIWSAPQLTADRLLFNLLWTAWLVSGTILEERDLVSQFGGAYREYQRRVPMLVPWRSPRANPPG